MRLLHACLFAIVGLALLPACRSGGQPPQNAGSTDTSYDGGTAQLPPPPPPSKKGVIVPSDTGLGASDPSGMKTDTGTNGRAVGPSLGNPGSSN